MTPSHSHPSYSSYYERVTGNCTRLVAAQMLSTISPPIISSSYILDNACGPGMVTEQVKLLHPDARIMATDLAPAMLEQVQQRIEREGWSDVQSDILDVRDLKSFGEGTFSHVFTNFGLLVPGDAEAGVKVARECLRVLRVGGVAVISTWADRVWPSAFCNTARAIRPHEDPQNSIAIKPEWMRGSWLMTQLENAGFGNDVEVRPCLTYTSAPTLDELVDNLLLIKEMFFKGYSDEELERARPVFREEVRELRTFEERDGEARIGMKAWIGMGWKRGNEGEVPA
ncbi:hypothetical protein H2201_005774 [Coniosporium apollinis]|uniref:Methyltransferase domain-containing protein n=1 Tax=Coniosporium apollinis TaxID=61459 RepID=A0ABQ9NS68_9PEZI|nr:hypothetical protein H2201_005774 [Coniosporium apollinis]